MQIAIISDSHDNVINLEKIITWLNEKKIFILIHTGDLCAPSLLKETIGPKYKGKVHMILGNVGDPVILEQIAADFPNVKYYGQKGEVEIDKRKIAFVHTPQQAEELTQDGEYDLVIFGHTHLAEIKELNDNLVVNPGTLGGLYNEATFAIYDTESDNVEIKKLDEINK